MQLITSPLFEWLEFTKTLPFGHDFLPTGKFIEVNFVTMPFNSKKLTQANKANTSIFSSMPSRY